MRYSRVLVEGVFRIRNAARDPAGAGRRQNDNPGPLAAQIAEHVAEEALTPREVQVLQLVARGNRSKEVASQLSIADETVRRHMKNILGKPGAHDRAHAVTIAVARGLLRLGEAI